MDKLKPILTHRFWIISAPAILLPLIGWWMASAAVTKQIDDRETALKAAFDSIPSTDTPNDSWTEGLTEINKSIEKQNEESANFLWHSQERLMFWPDNIKDMMAKIPYRGDPSNNARDLFRTSYFTTWDKVFQTVHPYNYQTGEGLVLFDKYSAPRIDDELWEDYAPTAEEMWDAQEDVWLLKAMLESIHRVNANSSRLTESPIRSVEILEFRGGSKTSPGGGAAGGAAGAAGGAAGMPGGAADAKAGGPAIGMSRGGVGTGANGMGGGGPAPADFPPEDEFGSQESASTAGGAGGDMPGAAGTPGAAAGGAAGGAAGANFGGTTKLIRYVDDDKDMPFKTRGFYLQVVMEIRHVPELIVELTNSPYPVRVVRVQQADVMMDDVDTSGGGFSRSPMGRSRLPGGMGEAGQASTRGRGMGSSRGPLGNRASSGAGRGPLGAAKGGDSFRTGPGSSAQDTGDFEAVAQSALSDPDLCTVAIAGLMTIYRPVEAKETTPGTSPPPRDVIASGADVSDGGEEPAADDESTEEMSESDSEPSADDSEPVSEDDGSESENTDDENSDDEPATDESNPDDSESDLEDSSTESPDDDKPATESGTDTTESES